MMCKQIFETERLFVRELCEEDWTDLCEILQDVETMYAYAHAFSEEEVRAWLAKQFYRYEQDGVGLWAVIHKETGEFVGQAGLTWQDTDKGREMEIGYLLKRKHWHYGYAAEAAVGCRDYAFYKLGKKRIVSIIRDDNYASQRVAERVGMVKGHVFTKHYYGIDMPHFVYAIER